LFLNSGYNPVEKVIHFEPTVLKFRLWRTYYLRWQEYKYPELGDVDLQELFYSLNFASSATLPEFSLKKKRLVPTISSRQSYKKLPTKRKKKPKERTNTLV